MLQQKLVILRKLKLQSEEQTHDPSTKTIGYTSLSIMNDNPTILGQRFSTFSNYFDQKGATFIQVRFSREKCLRCVSALLVKET